ncbi:hypothetical protein [Natrinema caseinilyticum]|uniref:hypothetical protein n=1 Tax=Natrinema caseinilyticum TaxID=2961570 RepID=UPI0020C5606D|nr:hypothetical protein [Natrinema caseinilyticum]
MPLINQDLGGGYRLIVQLHSHELNTTAAYCLPSNVRQNKEPSHYNIKLYENGDEVFNLHGGAYRDGGNICLFMFETATEIPYCYKNCYDSDPDMGEISTFVENAIENLEEAARDFEANNTGAAAVAAGAVVAAIAYVGPSTIATALAAAWAVPFVPPPP